jgi:SAM-dependent methyltransferase
MSGSNGCGRRCLACNSVESIEDGELIWPIGWRCSVCGYEVAQTDGIPMFAPELADTVDGFDPKSFNDLAELESGHFWFVSRNELIVGLANKFFPTARRFLEIGCGTGFVLRAMTEARRWERSVGSELHPSGLAFARKRVPQSEFVQIDARNIPATGLFDLIGAFDVIEHIEDDEAVLRGMRAAATAGGGAIVAVPQHPSLWSRADEIAHHKRRYRRGEVEQKLRRNGFEVLFSSSFIALLLPLMIASRLGSRKSDGDSDAHEFKLNPVVNRRLLSVARLEVRMTMAGLRWPAGGSRVVVARAI